MEEFGVGGGIRGAEKSHTCDTILREPEDQHWCCLADNHHTWPFIPSSIDRKWLLW